MAASTVEADTVSSSTCVKCGLVVGEQTATQNLRYGLVCIDCNNIYQMLYRHLGGMPGSLHKMSQEEQQSFYRNANGAIKVAPRNGRWALVRASLVSSMTKFRTEQTVNSVTSDFLPLSVWAHRGFDTEKIQKEGQKRDNPVSWKSWSLTFSINAFLFFFEEPCLCYYFFLNACHFLIWLGAWWNLGCSLGVGEGGRHPRHHWEGSGGKGASAEKAEEVHCQGESQIGAWETIGLPNDWRWASLGDPKRRWEGGGCRESH